MLKKTTTNKAKSKVKLKWCSRVLVTSPLYIGLCTSELSYGRELKRLNAEPKGEWLEGTEVGKVHPFEDSDGGVILIVCVKPSDCIRDLQATLVHESVHVWQFVKEYIGENEPSKEFEAYSVENIYTTLMDAYNEQHPRHTKRKQRPRTKAST